MRQNPSGWIASRTAITTAEMDSGALVRAVLDAQPIELAKDGPWMDTNMRFSRVLMMFNLVQRQFMRRLKSVR